jgi:exosortase/archaeosortase
MDNLIKLANILIVCAFLIFSIFFVDSVFGLNIYQDYLYTKSLHNSVMIILFVLFVILPTYGIYRVLKKRDNSAFNYIAILGSLLYLYPIYIELIEKTN